jgi:hypothetical protein
MGRGANDTTSAAAPALLREVVNKRRGDGNTDTWNRGLPDRVLDDGTQQWLDENGRLHRDDGPALVLPNGQEEWYRHGILHREDGPAVVWPDGREAWCRHGMLHREDGPAVVRPDGREEWWRNGKPQNAPRRG